MPVRDMTKREAGPDAAELTAAIVREWQHPSENPDQPIVLLDRKAPGDARHVFVVWNRWGAMDQLERSEAIVDQCLDYLRS